MTSTVSPVRSMTGQGHARAEGNLGSVAVEIRTVNHRGIKISNRLSDSLTTLEPKIESLVRAAIHRGSVILNVSHRGPAGSDSRRIDVPALRSYLDQLRPLHEQDPAVSIDLAQLISLPGVLIADRTPSDDGGPLLELVGGAVRAAIENLNAMRTAEGESMARALIADADAVRDRLDRVIERAPAAAAAYRERIDAKVRRLLADHGVKVGDVDLLREVQVFADRVDVSEETTRLASHLDMFRDVLGESEAEPTGRKLDFIIQEMFRETNTIGSKASDSAVSAEVVEIKCALERMRELVQNLE